MVLHGVDQARRLRRLQQGGAREGQERGRLVRIPHGVNNNRVSSKNIVFFTGDMHAHPPVMTCVGRSELGLEKIKLYQWKVMFCINIGRRRRQSC